MCGLRILLAGLAQNIPIWLLGLRMQVVASGPGPARLQ